MVDARKFGDHITGDYLTAKSEPEVGIDDDRVAMVVKDVLTDFRYVYPVGRRDASSTILMTWKRLESSTVKTPLRLYQL